jgi:hypothetical protein
MLCEGLQGLQKEDGRSTTTIQPIQPREPKETELIYKVFAVALQEDWIPLAV